MVEPRTPRPAVLLLLAGALLLSGCGRLGGWPLQQSQNATVRLEPGTRVGQTFAPAGAAVAGVDVLTATFATTPDGVLTVRLRDGTGGEVLATDEVDGADVRDNGWTPARFDPPVASPELAAVELAWEGDAPIALYANLPPDDLTGPEVGGGERLLNDPYAGGELVRDEIPAVGDLAFRAVGAGGAGAAGRMLRDTAADAAAALRRTPVFAVGWALLLLGGASLAIWGLRGGRGGGGRAAGAAGAAGAIGTAGHPGPAVPGTTAELGQGGPDQERAQRHKGGAEQA